MPSRLPPEEIERIRELTAQGLGARAIARELGRSRSVIQRTLVRLAQPQPATSPDEAPARDLLSALCRRPEPVSVTDFELTLEDAFWAAGRKVPGLLRRAAA
jgi:IS30 family transposase